MPTTTITIEVDEALAEEIAALGLRAGVSTQDLVRDALVALAGGDAPADWTPTPQDHAAVAAGLDDLTHGRTVSQDRLEDELTAFLAEP